MTKGRRTSVVILITLAELAWLAAFGLLFAYRGKAKESRKAWVEYREATNTARQLLADGERAAEQVRAEEEKLRKVTDEVAEKNRKLQAMGTQLDSAGDALVELRRKWDALPPNAEKLGSLYQEATNLVEVLRTELKNAHTNIAGLSGEIGRLQMGEIAIRRELTGLPTNELRRVVFVVDTSSSMRSKPAVWDEARKLMRTWVEHLSVKECRLVNFNDSALAFPTNSYLKVRDTNGVSLTDGMKTLLAKFDDTQEGVYSDLLKGLKLAYEGDQPDLIVVLTDGHPHVRTRIDSSYGAEILKEVSKHPGTPILAVAVGSYEIEGVGGPRERRNAAIAFMKELARVTGGNFLGR